MDHKLEISISKASKLMNEAQAFYIGSNRKTNLSDEDTLVIARSGSEIVGLVRLCEEDGAFTLRTMQVRSDLQQSGVGKEILKNFDRLVRSREITTVFCMPYAHLENFYGTIGFAKISDSAAPQFLQTRVSEARTKYPDEHFILMKR